MLGTRLNRSRGNLWREESWESSGSGRPVLRLRGQEPHPRQEPPMTEKAISPLRRRLIDDMAIRRLGPKTQHDYIRRVKSFADFVGHSPDKATAEDVHRYQLWLASIGATVSTVNATASALRFFFKITLKRSDLADEVVSVREPRRLPVVLSPEEVGRL